LHSNSYPPPLNNKNQQFSNNDIEENTWVVSLKPLEQWDASDFRSVGCIHCINNGGYHGSVPLTTEEYEWHIVNRHKPGTPAYPGPADIEKYGLKLPTTDSNGNGETKKSDLADIAETNLAGNGLMGSREGEEAG
jgi:hypothetical protein